MYNIETSYSSYQELLLDLDIFGRLMGTQNLDDKEAFKELLFQEYVKSHPLPTSEGIDCELSEPVSTEYHVSYIHELELAQNEEVMNFDEDDDLDVAEDDEIEEFSGDVDEVESNFGSIGEEPNTYNESVSVNVEEEQDDDEYNYSDEDFDYDTEDDSDSSEEVNYDEDFDYSDDVEDETVEEDIDYSDDMVEDVVADDTAEEDIDYSDDVVEDVVVDGEDQDGYLENNAPFVDSVYDNPKPVVQKPRDIEVSTPNLVIPNNRGTPTQEEVVDRSKLPSDILQYLREHPRCEISEVLKYYPRKELEKYIRTGRVIKKGSKVYI